MRRRRLTRVIGAVVGGVVLASGMTAVVAAPAEAAGTSCTGDQVTLRMLASGCAVASGTAVVVPDGRTFAVPAPGTSVAASSVAAPGAEELADVVVSNAGASGIAVRIGTGWRGAPAAVTRERSALATRVAAAAPAASCGSSAYSKLGYRWTDSIDWYYNSNSQRVYGLTALQRGANAWNGTLTACGRTRTSDADNTYVRVAKQAPGVTSTGGCTQSNRYSVSGWGTLPTGTLGLTCVWYRGDGTAVEADQRYSTRYLWNSATSCSGARFDLRAVATHEWGHSYGLGHTADDTGLVMAPSGGYCDTASRTLGLGDVLGIGALY